MSNVHLYLYVAASKSVNVPDVYEKVQHFAYETEMYKRLIMGILRNKYKYSFAC